MMRTMIVVILACLLCACTSVKTPNVNLTEAADANLKLGYAYLQEGALARAKYKFELALQQWPNVQALKGMGDYYLRTNDGRAAERYLAQALQKAPHDYAVMNNYAVVLCRLGRVKQAEELFERLLRDPDYQEKARVQQNIKNCRKA